jgi:hypothetical protein
MELLTSQEPIHDLLRAHQLTAWDGGEIANLLAMGGDMVMIIRPSGVISDIALGNMAIEHDDHKSWIGKNWAEIVAIDSRKKVEQLLDDARNKRPARWREINHFTQLRQNISLRFVAMAIGEKGEVLALGRDHRATASLQQRLLEAQQSLERDYAHMRDTESRYRTLFKVTT